MTKLVLIPFIIILIFYFVTKNEKYDNNITLEKPKISVLSLQQFKDFIQTDKDGFVNNLTVYDLRARKMLSQQDYITSIINSCNYNLNNDTINKVKKLCNKSDNIIKRFYPELYHLNWNICIFEGKVYEGGFPHTRLDIIFIPLDLLLYADENTLIKTFIHEKIHILQRLKPNSKLVVEFLKDNNFTKYMTIQDMRSSHPRCRSNPDLDEWIYSDNNRFYLCEYSKDYPDGLMDVVQSNNLEHPFEIMAYRISEELSKFYN